MYDDKEVGNNENSTSSEDRIVNETVTNENISGVISINKTPFFFTQVLFCGLVILIILLSKYGFNSQSLNECIVEQITYDTTRAEVEEFIRHILEY